MSDEDDAPKRNGTLSFAALTAAGLTLICIAIGQGAEQFADLTTPRIATGEVAAAKTPKFNAIDYSATGSLKGQPVVISPCDR